MPLILRTVLALLLCVHAITPAGAQTTKERLAMANMIDHTLECFTYFKIIAQCARNTDPSDELAVRYDLLADQVGRTGSTLAVYMGLKKEAYLAKTKHIMQRHMDRMDNDCLNVSVLFQYAERCKRLVEAPDVVLKEFPRK